MIVRRRAGLCASKRSDTLSHPDFIAARGADFFKLADIADISGFMKNASLAG